MARRKTPDEFDRALQKWGRDMSKNVAVAVEGGIDRMVVRAKVLVPVDEGKLRDSIERAPVKTRGYIVKSAIVARAGHAHLIEYGTVKMEPRPFVRPSVDEELAQMGIDITDRISDAAVRAGVGDKGASASRAALARSRRGAKAAATRGAF